MAKAKSAVEVTANVTDIVQDEKVQDEKVVDIVAVATKICDIENKRDREIGRELFKALSVRDCSSELAREILKQQSPDGTPVTDTAVKNKALWVRRHATAHRYVSTVKGADYAQVLKALNSGALSMTEAQEVNDETVCPEILKADGESESGKGGARNHKTPEEKCDKAIEMLSKQFVHLEDYTLQHIGKKLSNLFKAENDRRKANANALNA